MFSKRCFSEWCVQRVVRIRKGRRRQKALKHWRFQALFVPPKGLSSVATQGEESEKTSFGKHRLEPLGGCQLMGIQSIPDGRR